MGSCYISAPMLGGEDDGKLVAHDSPYLKVARLVELPVTLAVEAEPPAEPFGVEVEDWELVDYVRPVEVGKLHGRIGRCWVRRGGPFDPRAHVR